MSASSLIPAAQYLRMSTDDQPNSIPFQRDAIQRYASSHGVEIVATYSDAGKSGLHINNRPGLRNLLRDALSGKCRFRAVLVYDVSRWGRFQDTDESAHYEFLCRRAGIPVQYCAEQFENDSRMQNVILKSLKRIMAAEFSRELGARISGVKKRLAAEGFHEGGAAPYGLRRSLVSANGHRRVLQKGENKNLKSDHVVLTLGPKREVDCVRTIFALAAKKKNTPRAIAEELNRRKLHYFGNKKWDHVRVYRTLKMEEYTGSSVWGKAIWLSGKYAKRLPRDTWIVKPGAFPPIITHEEFVAAQRQLARRRTTPRRSDKYYLDKLTEFLARAKGKSSESLARERHAVIRTCCHRFGGLLHAYELIGHKPSSHVTNSIEAHNKIDRLRGDLFNQLKLLFASRMRMFHHCGARRFRVLELDNHWRVAVYICRNLDSYGSGARRWWVRIRPREERMPTLFCIPDSRLSRLEAFYFVPDLGPIRTDQPVTVNENHKWLCPENRLPSIDDLYSIVTKAMEGHSQNPPEEVSIIGDVVFSQDDPTMVVDGSEIRLSRATAHIFRVLLRNAGHVVPRSILSVSRKQGKEIRLDARVANLRTALGPQFRNRIVTYRNEGYMYKKVTEARWMRDPTHDGLMSVIADFVSYRTVSFRVAKESCPRPSGPSRGYSSAYQRPDEPD